MSERPIRLKDRLVKMAVDGLIASAVTIGYKLKLFEVLAEISSSDNPASSEAVAEKADCKERYVREWLGVMATGMIIEVTPDEKFWIAPENLQDLTVDNSAMFKCMHLPCYLKAYDQLVDAFRRTGPYGLSYSDFNNYVDVMDTESTVLHKNHFIKDVIPLISSTLHDELLQGDKIVLDVGCGSGFHAALMARAFPHSTFVGIDVTSEAIVTAKQQKKNDDESFDNVIFHEMDGGHMNEEWTGRYDLALIINACHDQLRPDKCLKEIHRVLKPGGIFAMLEIIGSSNVYEDKQKFGEVANDILCSSLFHCLPVGSNSEDALCLGAMWGSKRAVKLLNECGFNDVRIVDCTHLFETNQLYVCRKEHNP